MPGKLAAVLSLFILLLSGCAKTVATIHITGSPGAAITGYYVQNGTRVPLSGVLPQTLEKPGVQVIAVRKVNKEDALAMEVRVTRPGGPASSDSHMKTGSPAGNADGIRFVLEGGFYTSVIFPGESLDPPQEGVLTLTPYWYNNTWVFDDPRFGLTREAFVKGTPEMIDTFVKDIPNARAGFQLTFSQKSFPGYQKKITWVKQLDGGNVYRCDDPPMQGWLCPELFRYFTKTPKELFVRADPK